MNTINKIIAYKTDIQNTANIIEMFSNSINVHIKGINSKCLHINEFFKNGISKDTDAIITLGILRGTGHLLKEAASKNINRYYIDHAYFEPGYEGDSWLRISKNKSENMGLPPKTIPWLYHITLQLTIYVIILIM